MPIGRRSEKLQLQKGNSEELQGTVVIRKNQLFWIAIILVSAVVGVGLLCYYVPDRGCQPQITDPDTVTKVMSTEDMTTTKDTTQYMTNEDFLAKRQNTTEAPYPCRLPTEFVPISYKVFLKPYLNEEDVEGTSKDRFTFDGHVEIVTKCQSKTNRITLHSNDIEISSVRLTGPGLVTFPTWEYQTDAQLVHFNIDPDVCLKVGKKYTLDIVYVGQLNDLLAGFYRGSYTNSTGHRSWVSLILYKDAI